jgi:addiction module HigA family antidote
LFLLGGYLTQKELAQQMGVSYMVFNEILNGKRPVTTEYALLLEAALGTDANIGLGLQADYNMQRFKQDRSFMKRLEKIRKIAAVF